MQSFLPYGRQIISEEDIQAVVDVLRSDWLTTGPAVETFEQAMCSQTKASEAVAVSSGTAALHAAMHALGITEGDEVIVPAMTFAATANAVLYCSGTVVFADVDERTLLLDPASVSARLTRKTRAIITVDYAGQPSEYDELRAICRSNNLALVADSCHALGALYKGVPIGGLADLTTFSFHPVKHITTGEGGMVTTNDATFARRMRRFRNHGITTDHRQRTLNSSFFYEMVDLGFNYRLSDLQCALGTSQLRKLGAWVKKRQQIAGMYDAWLKSVPGVRSLSVLPDRTHAYHLYVVRLEPGSVRSRADVFASLREQGIGVNVHYIPVHLHPYYREQFGFVQGLCPQAEDAYESILSLPMFPKMEESDVDRVVNGLIKALQ